MIRAEYSRSKQELTVEGHAGYAPEGQDIVCASVSILILTAALRLRELFEEDHTHFPEPMIVTEKGYARVQAMAKGRHKKRTKEVFSVICAGLRQMAEEYPDNVCYREIL